MRITLRVLGFAALTVVASSRASADFLLFDTGAPDGKMAMASRPAAGGKAEIEAADDFIANGGFTVTGASFTGLLSGGATIGDVGKVVVEIYRVFPKDSTDPPSGNVLTRVNSPSDVAFTTRDSAAGEFATLTTTLLNSNFSAANSVLNGINKFPNQTTGGEGAVRGQEVLFDVTFNKPLTLPADHYFLVPQVQVTGGEFYWLSAPKPIVGPFGFAPDLQAWIRKDALQPDWSRVGTDIVGPINGVTPTFNGSFSLVGVPEPSSVILFALGATAFAVPAVRRRRVS